MAFFEKSYREAWEQLAREINAAYVRRKGVFGSLFFSGEEYNDSVELNHKNLKIIISASRNSHSAYTWIRAHLDNKTNLDFAIGKSISYHFPRRGMNMITTGDVDLDKNFRIKGNNELIMQRLFANKNISNLLCSLGPGIVLATQYKLIKSIDVLALCFNRTIKDVERLKVSFALFVELIDTMEQIDLI